MVHPTKRPRTTKTKQIKHKQKAKRAAGIKGQVATMLELHTRQTDTIDIIAMKRARENEIRTTKSRQSRSVALGRPAMKLLGREGVGFN